MLLARRILLQDTEGTDYSRVLEEHDSFYHWIGCIFHLSGQQRSIPIASSFDQEFSAFAEEFEKVEQRFLEGRFPHDIMEQFRDLLDYFGQAPIIVRSSSLLEDGFGNAFAGKYRSEFCPNQGGPEVRMRAFLRAVKLVYASAVNPDALSYRRQRGLGNADEQMAILVQRVSGMRYKRYFFPQLAGVAFSHNLYRWSDRIDPNQGIIRLVFGLGTRAVDRLGGNYPRMIPLSNPQLRPEIGSKIASYSQRELDLLDLSANDFRSRRVADVIADADYPNLHLFLSFMEDGYVRDPGGRRLKSLKNGILTFNNLIAQTDFILVMRALLARLEAAYGYPIDTEFTAFVDAEGKVKINLLQCRPMRLAGLTEVATLPDRYSSRAHFVPGQPYHFGRQCPAHSIHRLYRSGSLRQKGVCWSKAGDGANRRSAQSTSGHFPSLHDADGTGPMGQLQRHARSEHQLRRYQQHLGPRGNSP